MALPLGISASVTSVTIEGPTSYFISSTGSLGITGATGITGIPELEVSGTAGFGSGFGSGFDSGAFASSYSTTNSASLYQLLLSLVILICTSVVTGSLPASTSTTVLSVPSISPIFVQFSPSFTSISALPMKSSSTSSG